MSGPSSPRDPRRAAAALAVTALGLGACGRQAKAPPIAEADPAQVRALAATMVARAPNLGGVRDCTDADLKGGLTMTQVTLLRLAGQPVDDAPTHAPWMNPVELDAPVARALLDASPTATATRQAAAAWLSAPFYLVYRVDNVDAPLALAIKEPKIGTIGARVIRHERSGAATCVIAYFFQNDKARSDWAIGKSDRAAVDPAVAQAMQEDLHAQYVKHAPHP